MMRLLAAPFALLALGGVVVAVIDRTIRPQTGPPALAAVVEEQLVFVGALAAILALLVSLRSSVRLPSWIGAIAVASLVTAVLVLGGGWWSPPASGAGGAGAIHVLSWNLELGSKAARVSVEGIAERDVDLVALQELTPDVATAIEDDPRLVARFPYRILEPRDGVGGAGLLSRVPLAAGGFQSDPVVLRAALFLPGGRRIDMLDVHPYPPDITRTWRLPTGLDTLRRDADLASIRTTLDGLADPDAVLVVGDLNSSPTEPGFDTIADGLRDAHEVVGIGPGFTWRPSSLEGLGVGMLRIDHVLTGAVLDPTAVDEDCGLAGDHCRLYVTLEPVSVAGGGAP
jgi:endonuclease/exonuclease/phosphatase (EEP) superfamily protein YafD